MMKQKHRSILKNEKRGKPNDIFTTFCVLIARDIFAIFRVLIVCDALATFFVKFLNMSGFFMKIRYCAEL